ncbi:hypothetical protein F5Y16DRAFT_383627 [Xylariaceae sp. FL0255]|nr:hypothetical protein F5Y16DRAFT_383627 [Xylariaceae sp. FL0255]
MARRVWQSIPYQEVLSHRRIWLFPFLAGTIWFATLTILLSRWLYLGRPQYPGQVNPYVPFISDIAAQTFKPVFIVGCATTGLSFFGTVFAVHHVRYSSQFYGLVNDASWRQTVSLIALFGGLSAAVSLILLSVFDTVDSRRPHRYLLMSTFGGLSVSALTTTVVWWDQTIRPVVFKGLRKWCLFNAFLVFCEVVLGVLFIAFLWTNHFRISGVLEWCITYIGSFWLLSFIGYTRFREGERPEVEGDGERQPLLT